MDFFDWLNKETDKAFERIDKRMNDVFNNVSNIVDPDYVDIRTDSQKEEAKARSDAYWSNLLISQHPRYPIKHPDLRTEKEKREDAKDVKEAAYDINETLGDIVDKAQNIGDTLTNATDGSNLLKIITNEFKEDAVDLKRGDHLIVQRIGFLHHGIYIGEEEVMHYENGIIHKDSIEAFKNGATLNKLSENESPSSFSGDAIVQRAFSRYCESSYNLVYNNCEHFCRWCRYGLK